MYDNIILFYLSVLLLYFLSQWYFVAYKKELTDQVVDDICIALFKSVLWVYFLPKNLISSLK